MSRRWPGGIVRKTPVTPCGPYFNSAAPGVWTLSQAEDLKKQCLWPTVGRTNTGQTAYTTPGTYTWVVPGGITSVSVVVVSSGGNGGQAGLCPCTGNYYSGGGYGGALAYRNNIAVTRGESITVRVGNDANKESYFKNSSTAYANGPSSRVGDGGGNGGTSSCNSANTGGAGGGGAGGYSGNGGNGGYGCSNPPGAGAGGGGGGGFRSVNNAYGGSGGGGVGLLGQGSNGAAGLSTITNRGGKAGSGGTDGSSNNDNNSGGSPGGYYGGGGGGAPTYCTSLQGGAAGTGAVRIIWPGSTRQFPSTCTGNL